MGGGGCGGGGGGHDCCMTHSLSNAERGCAGNRDNATRPCRRPAHFIGTVAKATFGWDSEVKPDLWF